MHMYIPMGHPKTFKQNLKFHLTTLALWQSGMQALRNPGTPALRASTIQLDTTSTLALRHSAIPALRHSEHPEFHWTPPALWQWGIAQFQLSGTPSIRNVFVDASSPVQVLCLQMSFLRKLLFYSKACPSDAHLKVNKVEKLLYIRRQTLKSLKK